MLDAGWMTRRVSVSDESTFYNPDGTVDSTSGQGAIGWKHDGYIQEASSFFGRRLHLAGGLRVDTAELFDIHPVSPQLGASWQLASATQLQFGVGRYTQFQFPVFPTIELPLGLCLLSSEVLQTANHFTAGIEQRIGESARVKFTFFDRQNTSSDAVTGPNNCKPIISPHGFEPYERDHSRGAQIVLQSRTANRLSGWIGYTLTYALQHNVSGPYYPTLEDQRHTVNVFASYRISPTVHVSGKWLFGSGFPIPSEAYNSTTLGDYQRLDVRAEKDWAFTRWKLALYGEALNLTNHNNRRYFYAEFTQNGTTVTTGQGLPITPTAGIAFEF